MGSTVNVDAELFRGAPPLRLERALRLVQPDQQRIVKRATLAALVAWVPLAALAALQEASFFFSDFTVYARYLVALPALILAEADCIPRLGRIATHFAETGLIAEPDTARFQAAVSSTRRLLDSTASEVIVLALAYLAVLAVVLYLSPDALPVWHRREATGVTRLSPAGWWHVLVSAPLLLIFLFGWLWRLALWARFLFLMSRLNLQLIPGHPDRVGGLKFVGSSLRGFRLISLALGAILAGAVANGQIHHGRPLVDYKGQVIGLLAVLLVLFAGPLTIFMRKLRQTKRHGVFEYGALARAVGRQFESKWLRQTASLDQSSLEAPDFSATTDLYSITANVYAMRAVPFSLKDLMGPIVVTALVPLVPVALVSVPFKVIIQGLAKLLL